MKITLICPHIDDDLIGNFQLFSEDVIENIIYLTWTKERKKEAEAFCESMKISCKFMEIDRLITDLLTDTYNDKILFVPSVLDNHPFHKQVNQLVKFFHPFVGYYSIDMNTEWVYELPKSEQEEKRRWLNKYYPSQKSLWEQNYKYFLFEGHVVRW